MPHAAAAVDIEWTDLGRRLWPGRRPSKVHRCISVQTSAQTKVSCASWDANAASTGTVNAAWASAPSWPLKLIDSTGWPTGWRIIKFEIRFCTSQQNTLADGPAALWLTSGRSENQHSLLVLIWSDMFFFHIFSYVIYFHMFSCIFSYIFISCYIDISEVFSRPAREMRSSMAHAQTHTHTSLYITHWQYERTWVCLCIIYPHDSYESCFLVSSLELCSLHEQKWLGFAFVDISVSSLQLLHVATRPLQEMVFATPSLRRQPRS